MKFLPGPARARSLWRVFQGLTAIWIGLGYAIGPPFFYASPTLYVLQELPVPIPAWGWAMVIAGILVLTPARALGHVLLFAIFGFWSACVAVNAVANLVSYAAFVLTGEFLQGAPPIASWGGDALFLTVALLHLHQFLSPIVERPDSPAGEGSTEVT